MVSYERISREVILVPVNGVQCPQNAQYIKDELNRIYAPAIVSWTVKLAASLRVDNLKANGFGSSEMNAFSRYTPNMRKLTRAFKKTGQKGKHTLVLFFIADNSVDFTGFMPLSSDFGFIFNFGSESEVLAHELAHGAFNLRHTFSTKAKYPLAKKTTRNLMDYNKSSELWKYQWDRIHNLESIFFSAYDEDEGAYGNANIELVEVFFDNMPMISKKDVDSKFSGDYNNITLDSEAVLIEGIQLDEIVVTANNGSKTSTSSKAQWIAKRVRSKFLYYVKNSILQAYPLFKIESQITDINFTEIKIKAILCNSIIISDKLITFKRIV